MEHCSKLDVMAKVFMLPSYWAEFWLLKVTSAYLCTREGGTTHRA